jgi:hypothetical protein
MSWFSAIPGVSRRVGAPQALNLLALRKALPRQQDTGVAASFGLPAVVQWIEVLLVLSSKHCPQPRGVFEVGFVSHTFETKFLRDVHQVARRSELAGHCRIAQAFVKV